MSRRNSNGRAHGGAAAAGWGVHGPSDTLRVAITFRRPGDRKGPKSFGAALTAAAVMDVAPAHTEMEHALGVLSRMGFKVTSRGRMSASVRCSRALYEKVFGTRLQEHKVKPLVGTAAPSVYFPPKGAPWNPDPAIANLIDDAYIQWPHIYLSTGILTRSVALRKPRPAGPSGGGGAPAAGPTTGIAIFPPTVTYPHLRVPGDVALGVDAAKAHRQGITGRGVRVAMIDTGFAHSHPYFQGNGYNSTVVLAAGATNDAIDGNGHGTGESANLLAIAPDATFIGIKLEDEAGGNGASILEGFQAAMAQNPQVISVSLCYDLVDQSSPSRAHLTSLPNSLVALQTEIQAAVAEGVVVVFAAGNGHVAFPAMMPEVIAVGGTHMDPSGAMEASDYASAFESKIYPGRRLPDLCGLVGMQPHADYIELPIPPGCEIDSENSAHDGTGPSDGWGVFSGTSAATPQLAGVCALLLQKNAGLTPTEVKSVLMRTARDVTTGQNNNASSEGVAILASAGDDGATGAGLVDANEALRQV
jgi:subtilisin family serine protease